MPNWYSRSAPVDLNAAGLISRGKWALTIFEGIGVKPHQSSRLPKALKQLEELNRRTDLAERASNDLLNSIAEAHRTIWEFFVIAYSADTQWQCPATPFTASMLSKALGGADHAEDDKNTAARNTQFELYVASLLVMGGPEVSLGEPDLRMLYRGVEVGIAVKRMSSVSVNTLETRLLEAVDQILQWTSQGLVAINIDVHFRNEELPDDIS